MKRVIITGASGFVGQHLTNLLKEQGTQVINVDRRNGYDVLDGDAIRKLFAEVRPDAVYHLAGFSSVSKSWTSPAACHALNVNGTTNVMEACRKIFFKGPIMVVTSSEVYGQAAKIPTQETAPQTPLNPYGESRVSQEKLVKEYEELHWIITRSYGHTGPGQDITFAFPSFAKRLLEVKAGRESLPIQVGHVDQWRDISDVRDIVKIYTKLVEKADPHTIVNVCSGKSYLIRNVIERIAKIIGVEPKLHINRDLKRPNDTDVQQGSTRLLHSIVGEIDRRDLAETLSDVVRYVRDEIS